MLCCLVIGDSFPIVSNTESRDRATPNLESAKQLYVISPLNRISQPPHIEKAIFPGDPQPGLQPENIDQEAKLGARRQ